MELSPLSSVLVLLLVLLNHCLSYQVVTNQDSESVIQDYKNRLKTQLGRPILTPQIQHIALEPASIRKCVMTGEESCYTPVDSQSVSDSTIIFYNTYPLRVLHKRHE